jgi:hypothetical protein
MMMMGKIIVAINNVSMPKNQPGRITINRSGLGAISDLTRKLNVRFQKICSLLLRRAAGGDEALLLLLTLPAKLEACYAWASP